MSRGWHAPTTPLCWAVGDTSPAFTLLWNLGLTARTVGPFHFQERANDLGFRPRATLYKHGTLGTKI